MAGRKRIKPLSAKRRGVLSEKDKDIESLINQAIDKGRDKFVRELMKLDGKEFVDRYYALFEYVKPKLQRVEKVGDDDKKPISINFISTGDTKKLDVQFPKNQDDGEMVLLEG